MDTLRIAHRKLIEQGTRPDVSTGSTPRKKTWEYVDHWDLTEHRQELLQRKANEMGLAPKRNEILSASMTSQPENEYAQGGESTGVNSMQAPSTADQARSPTPSSSSRSSTTQDSSVTQASSVELVARNKIKESLQHTNKRVSSVGGAPLVSRPPPLVESRLKNAASRRSSRFAR